MADPLAFTNLSEVEEQKRNQNMAKARMNYYSYNLKLRLQYAKLKVEHGWQQQSLSEVENLYFRHSRQPYPNTYPRKKTFRSNKNPSPLTAEATIVDSTSFSDTPLAASGSISSLARSDTLQTIPDSSSTMTSSRSSTLPNFTVGSSDVSRYPTIGIKYPVPVRLVSPPSTTTNGSLASHSQTLSVDPNIDPALLSSPHSASMQPPTLPAHDSVQPSPTISSSSSYFAPRESSVSKGTTRAEILSSSAITRAVTISALTNTAPATSQSLPTIPTPSSAPRPPQAQSSQPTLHRPIQPAPTPSQPSSSAFGSPLTYDSFWSSHQSSYGLKGGTSGLAKTSTEGVGAGSGASGVGNGSGYPLSSSAGAGSGRPTQSSANS